MRERWHLTLSHPNHSIICWMITRLWHSRVDQVKEHSAFTHEFLSGKFWCATFNPVWLIKIGWDSNKTGLKPFKPLSWLWLCSQKDPPTLSSAPHLQQPPSQKHKIKTRSSFYGQRLLADHCWSLTSPPSTAQGPPSARKAVRWLGGEGVAVEAWQGQRTRRQQLRGALRSVLERISSVTFIHD